MSKHKNLRKAASLALAGILGFGTLAMGDYVVPALMAKKVQSYEVHRKFEEAVSRDSKPITISLPPEPAISLYPEPTISLPPELARVADITISQKNPAGLESRVISTQETYNFSYDDAILLAKLLPIKSTLDKYTSKYNLNELWFLQTLLEESDLDPLAYNPITKDFGISQEKIGTFEKGRKIVLDKNGKYYCGKNLEDNIYNPESNIITSLGFLRSEMDMFKIPEEDKTILSAIYNLGYNGVDSEGNILPAAKSYFKLVEERKPEAEKLLSSFNVGKKELNKISNPYFRGLLSIYDPNLSSEEMYKKVFLYNVSKLSQGINPYSLWGPSIALGESVYYMNVVNKLYGVPETAYLPKISRFSQQLTKIAESKGSKGLNLYLSKVKAQLAALEKKDPTLEVASATK